jgi:SAM-dependent methyltransferase
VSGILQGLRGSRVMVGPEEMRRWAWRWRWSRWLWSRLRLGAPQETQDFEQGCRPQVRETKRVIAGLFGRVASGYDQAGFLHQIAQRLVAHAGVRPGDIVLDVACGTGAALLEAARLAGPDGVAVGVDLAEPMAAQAAGRLRALGSGRGAVAVMAFTAIEACREADGMLHWRPEVVCAIAST